MSISDWTLMGLIPTSGLLAWHLYNPTTSTNGNINDASGNARHLVQATTPPALTLEVMNDKPGWYFDGTANPLKYTGAVTPKTIFVLAAFQDAAFTQNRGLLSGIGASGGNWLTSEASGDEFFGFGAGYDYRKSDLAYDDTNMLAPVNNLPELIEVTNTAGVVMDGIQIGQQLNDTARKWKGYYFESLLYDRILTTNERRRIMLYFNIKFGTWARGVPLYFPSADLVPILGPRRFYEQPPDYDKITDSWEYEDANTDFNEVAPTAPRRWEYSYDIAESTAAQADAYRAIFDSFNDQARRANPFFFRDKYGEVFSNVRIEEYDRNHEGHKSWVHDVNFRLRSNTGTVITAADSGGAYIIDGGDAG